MFDNAPLIPVTLLTGFLGSGKTTLLNQLMQQPTMADTLVIINEFGEVGIDAADAVHAPAIDRATLEVLTDTLLCTE